MNRKTKFLVSFLSACVAAFVWIVAWQPSRPGAVPAATPSAAAAADDAGIVIVIRADGLVEMDGASLDLAQLREKLSAEARFTEDRPIRIRATGSVPYKHVTDVLQICSDASLRDILFSGSPTI